MDLLDFNDLYLNLKYKLNKSNKPIMSDEDLYYMDLKLKEAIHLNRQIIVTYYNQGYFNTLWICH